MKRSITIFVPAYNEEDNLESAVKRYNKIVKTITDDYEILIFDDGSTDKTGRIADALAKRYLKVKVIHNKGNKGLGYSFRKAVKLAKKNYFIFLTGEGETLDSSIKRLLKSTGKADIVVAYTGNTHLRPLYRRFISSSFTTLLNILFCLNLKYYNGQTIHRTKNLRKIKMTTDSFGFLAEVLVRLLKSGKKYSYIQVPYNTVKTEGSAMFNVRNLLGVIPLVLRLFIEIYFKKK